MKTIMTWVAVAGILAAAGGLTWADGRGDRDRDRDRDTRVSVGFHTQRYTSPAWRPVWLNNGIPVVVQVVPTFPTYTYYYIYPQPVYPQVIYQPVPVYRPVPTYPVWPRRVYDAPRSGLRLTFSW